MNDYQKCRAYQIKQSVKGICIGEDAEKCKTCPCYKRMNLLNNVMNGKTQTISKEGIFIEVNEEDLNKIMEFQDLTKTETVSDAVMLAIKIAKFTLTYTKKKENANDQQSE